MIDVAEFLLARIADDEQYARTVLDDDRGAARVALPGGQTRVLAECAAKRRVVEYCSALIPMDDRNVNGTHGITVLLMMAQPYAAHPEFREEWRP